MGPAARGGRGVGRVLEAVLGGVGSLLLGVAGPRLSGAVSRTQLARCLLALAAAAALQSGLLEPAALGVPPMVLLLLTEVCGQGSGVRGLGVTCPSPTKTGRRLKAAVLPLLATGFVALMHLVQGKPLHGLRDLLASGRGSGSGLGKPAVHRDLVHGPSHMGPPVSVCRDRCAHTVHVERWSWTAAVKPPR